MEKAKVDNVVITIVIKIIITATITTTAALLILKVTELFKK